ncbi:hypothetical protein [Ponticaulis sp.]|uniref:hypothetical protein n=1 Tax=Ponticaulis sp. TaxID=2020902 RepID=UPI000B759D22|nr:hypothetical protein [Ponticaulis sp.]MAI91854.1 hypothetical protein [Ponticaulis sp.]OUX96538.1 MAG: hypothetical protein CBB65_15600 [Hyphomonadaceae bacterium TMED5]|tara:strand:- start:12039 stop:12812 length:774 start_codon:yes stop_codon:yes gene_type:complete
MIVSHEHKYIHVKTQKTAGTTTAVLLGQQLVSGDATLPIDAEKEDITFPDGIVIKPTRELHGKQLKIDAHADIYNILSFFNDTPNLFEYKIVANERNPWDRVVSLYYWHQKLGRVPEDVTFKRFLYDRLAMDFGARTEYYYQDIPIADYVIRYEYLHDDMAELGRYLGLSKPLELGGLHFKGGVRKDKDYREMYDDQMARYVEIMFSRTITLFGYKFDDPYPTKEFKPLPNNQHMKRRVYRHAKRQLNPQKQQQKAK